MLEILQDHLDASKRLIGLKDYDGALERLARAREIESKHPEILRLVGKCQLALNRCEEAVDTLREAINVNQSEGRNFHNLGYALDALKLPKDKTKGYFEQAIKCYDQSIEVNPDSPVFIEKKAQCLMALERYDEAIAFFDKAIELDPENARYHFEDKIKCLERTNRYEEAISCCEKLIKLDGENSWAFAMKGRCLIFIERYESALLSLDQAVALDNNYVWALEHIFQILYELERYRAAERICHKLLKLQPNREDVKEQIKILRSHNQGNEMKPFV